MKKLIFILVIPFILNSADLEKIFLSIAGVPVQFKTMASGDQSLDGRLIKHSSDMDIKIISIVFTITGTSEIQFEFRYYNSKIWLEWKRLYLMDVISTSVFSVTGAVQFNIIFWDYYLDDMAGFQIRVIRNSGSGDVNFTDGYGVLAK